MSKETSYHFIKLWIQSMPEPLVFPVAEAAWGRFKKSYQARKSGFFIFATRDGRTLALNLGYVYLAQVWLEEEEKHSNPSSGSSLACFFARGSSESFEAEDPVDLARIFTALKLRQEDQTLSFNAGYGKLVSFDSSALILLEASTDFVEEGYKQIYFQDRGTLPPS